MDISTEIRPGVVMDVAALKRLSSSLCVRGCPERRKPVCPPSPFRMGMVTPLLTGPAGRLTERERVKRRERERQVKNSEVKRRVCASTKMFANSCPKDMLKRVGCNYRVC